MGLEIFLDRFSFVRTLFLTIIFCTQHFFWTKIYRGQIFFGANIFWNQIFWTQYSFWPTYFMNSNFFQTLSKLNTFDLSIVKRRILSDTVHQWNKLPFKKFKICHHFNIGLSYKTKEALGKSIVLVGISYEESIKIKVSQNALIVLVIWLIWACASKHQIKVIKGTKFSFFLSFFVFCTFYLKLHILLEIYYHLQTW